MPWQECNPMDERLKFIARLLDGEKMAAADQTRQAVISSFVGKRWVAFLENASRSPTRISKTPPPERRRLI